MSSSKLVFRKAKEIHYKTGGENPQVSVERIADELQLSHDEVNYCLNNLKNLRLIRVKENNIVEVTKVGLSTQVG
jgi:Mn-dependent DtxR family transcriptional regulator